MNRIDQKFQDLRRQKRKAFIAFITAGDPDLKTTEDLVLSFEKSGVDIVELGVPFSDPLADGPTIQAASQRALQNGFTLPKIFDLVRNIRKKSSIPIVLMMYYNPVFHFGEEAFVRKAKEAGVDGLVIPDLPPEEAGRLRKAAQKEGIAVVFFVSPTSTPQRVRRIVKASSGFIYFVSLTGVTGARQALPPELLNHVKNVKAMTPKPVCVGFGVSTGDQVREISRVADGVIVGSAIVKEIEKHAGQKGCVESVSRFVRDLTRGLDR